MKKYLTLALVALLLGSLAGFASAAEEKGPANFGNYYNAEANELLKALATASDENKQVEYLGELTKIWLQDVPAVPVYTGTVFYEANTKYWKDWPNEKNPYGVPIFWAGFGTWGTALALLGVKPTGVQDDAGGDFPRHETIYTANSAPPTSANPFQGGNIIGIDGLVFEPLFMLNFMTTELKPWLAESGTWVNDNTFEVKLREGTKWQDGRPLTAEDVKFSFEYYEKLGLKDWSSLGLKEIKVVDDRTVDFVFEGKPNVWAWRSNLYSVLIIPKHVFESLDPDKVKTMTFTGDDKQYLVGSGAYRLREVVQQQKSILERNDNWWGAKYFNEPAAKYIIQLYVSSNDQAANMFLKGDLDVATYYLDIAELKKQNPNIVSWLNSEPYFPPVVPVVLYFNTAHEPLNNPGVRRAIAMAINPQQIVQQGPISAVPDQTPLGPIMQGWKDKIGADQLINEYGWKYGDIAGAIKILDSLGIKDTDGDGVREYNGKPLELHFVTCSGCSDWIQAGEIIANQLKPLGIKVVIDKGDWTNFFMQKLNSGNFDLALHWAGTFKPDPYSVYYSIMYNENPPATPAPTTTTTTSSTPSTTTTPSTTSPTTTQPERNHNYNRWRR
ncbi:ABC transporter substrate-binding protein [Thermococcus celericrescens]|uniref:ABC transporter substrate-binding protein n=1 Tax=Thermococcus celericrescens TaxID=227598 RepID=UPI0009F8CDD6|nr:ABC transporter substrate-binding protein [Thermococcus celericrescens]